MTHFAIAGLQLELATTGNLDLIIKKTRVTLARFPWIQMVVLSELAVHGAPLSHAEALPSETEDRLADLARELGIWLVTGSLYEKQDGKIYNTATVLAPDGTAVARYRKMYPFYPYEKGVEPGADICVFDVPEVGRFGLSICYDMWFPETSRAMAAAGAEVILHPTLTNTVDRDVECAMARATAAQQQCYVIDVNGAGALASGRSSFVGPDGDILYAAGEAEDIIALEIDLSRVRRGRERGVLGLGQPLKSYRDAAHSYAHEDVHGRTAYLNSLGALEIPKRTL
ncbi:carbon-nitrogen hydrolase family protein [Kordiimonas marina]|uniref:carbon-nitrogen hydrolase family protein n=1 Tax=Kordiimonas marina TaxID=2872312 RepID=UPI001FF2E359|nr:carbon-nitrogen hydrolase family protein [Kordiimonas marina]MCJ9427549.1 carbon-nitrogen hydrolase family protein [Kordiimonas marina]